MLCFQPEIAIQDEITKRDTCRYNIITIMANIEAPVKNSAELAHGKPRKMKLQYITTEIEIVILY